MDTGYFPNLLAACDSVGRGRGVERNRVLGVREMAWQERAICRPSLDSSWLGSHFEADHEVAIPGGLLSLVARLQEEASVGSWGCLPRGLGSSARGLRRWVSMYHLVSLSVRQGGGEEGQALGC